MIVWRNGLSMFGGMRVDGPTGLAMSGSGLYSARGVASGMSGTEEWDEGVASSRRRKCGQKMSVRGTHGEVRGEQGGGRHTESGQQRYLQGHNCIRVGDQE